MLELLTNIGEIISTELDELQEVSYSEEETNVLFLLMNNGIKYKLELTCITNHFKFICN